MTDALTDSKLRLRRSSIGSIEINGLNVKDVVVVNEFSDADAELVAKFGYKPVFKRVNMFIPEPSSEDSESLTS